jgi:hypothetical protein
MTDKIEATPKVGLSRRDFLASTVARMRGSSSTTRTRRDMSTFRAEPDRGPAALIQSNKTAEYPFQITGNATRYR